jgi:hypothetical protein
MSQSACTVVFFLTHGLEKLGQVSHGSVVCFFICSIYVVLVSWIRSELRIRTFDLIDTPK